MISINGNHYQQNTPVKKFKDPDNNLQQGIKISDTTMTSNIYIHIKILGGN